MSLTTSSVLAFIALHVLHCVLLEIVLNAGSVVLEGAGGVRLPVSTGRVRRAVPCRAFAPACWPILWCVCI